MRQSVKKVILRLVVSIELVMFTIYIIWGARGAQAIWHVRAQNSALMHEVLLMQAQVDQIQNKIHDWQTYPYYQEQYAREQLQLGHKGDEIYLI